MNQEQINLIDKFEKILLRGSFCDGTEVTNLYNEVFNKNLRPSNCSSCIASRIRELLVARNAYKQAIEASKKEEVNNTPKEENNAPESTSNKAVGRPKKK